MSDEPVVSKDQRLERIKWNNIEFRFIQSLIRKIIGKLAILEMMLFDEPLNKQRATSRIVDVFKW